MAAAVDEDEDEEARIEEETKRRRRSMNGVQAELERTELQDKIKTTVKTFTTGDYFGEQVSGQTG